MAGLNKVFLIGNLGDDPEDFETNSGAYGCNFRMATNRVWKDRDGKKQEETDWHTVTCWEALAEVVMDHKKKGDSVHVEGRIRYEEWEDEDGNTRYSTKIIATNITFLSSGGGDDSGGGRRGRRGRDEEDEDDRGSGRRRGGRGSGKSRGRGKRGSGSRRGSGKSRGRGRGRSKKESYDDDDIPF